MSQVIDNVVKRELKAGHPTVGAWLHLCSPVSAEIMGDAGFDWLLVDMEHGPGDYQTLLGQLQAMQGSRATPLVRVEWNDPAVIKRVLDLGAHGVMIPWVGNRVECVWIGGSDFLEDGYCLGKLAPLNVAECLVTFGLWLFRLYETRLFEPRHGLLPAELLPDA